MVLASQVRAGMAILFEGQNYRVVSAEYRPAQGKSAGVTHTRLQNLHTGTARELSLQPELKLEDLPLDHQKCEFLYFDGDQCCVMNPDTFEQTEIPRSLVGPREALLEPGVPLTVELLHGHPVAVIFPDFLEVEIAETAPLADLPGGTALKHAIITTGLEVMVPQFLAIGDRIRIDTQTMKYVERARSDPRAKLL